MKIVISNTPPYFLDLDAPTVAAEPVPIDGVEQWRMWCGHCNKWHIHGPGEGHRIAHCDEPGGPYERSGYNLARVQSLTPLFPNGSESDRRLQF
jgi:hypothetical protein